MPPKQLGFYKGTFKQSLLKLPTRNVSLLHQMLLNVLSFKWGSLPPLLTRVLYLRILYHVLLIARTQKSMKLVDFQINSVQSATTGRKFLKNLRWNSKTMWTLSLESFCQVQPKLHTMMLLHDSYRQHPPDTFVPINSTPGLHLPNAVSQVVILGPK